MSFIAPNEQKKKKMSSKELTWQSSQAYRTRRKTEVCASPSAVPRENIDLLAHNIKFHESYNSRLRKPIRLS
jgi:hypothetical protein